MAHEWDLPQLREIIQVPSMSDADFWSVKFYPYVDPGVEPIFAVVGGKQILVCRSPVGNGKATIIQMIIDEEVQIVRDKSGKGKKVDASTYACAWSKDCETGAPLLCVAGSLGVIKVINALTGDLLRTLTGHGGEINDLVISPTNHYILASASEDFTVRIWSLDPAYANQPCAAILEGDGHKDAVMSLWTLPEFPDINTGTNIPTRIYYPHFSTSEVHQESVDCVAWWNDLILSKSANENTIVLWSINRFDSTAPPPSPSTACTTHDISRDTRSSFVTPPPASSSDNAIALYKRLLQFAIPAGQVLFTRFSLYPGSPAVAGLHPTQRSHPILAFCNSLSKTFFWDLARFTHYHDLAPHLPDETGTIPRTTTAAEAQAFRLPSAAAPKRHPFLRPFQPRNRGGAGRGRGSIARSESASSQQTADSQESGPKGKVNWAQSRRDWAARYGMQEPLVKLPSSSEVALKGIDITGRQVAWSVGGEWCVVVGSHGNIVVFHRWGKERHKDV
ncbi:hypothetical protein QTJ16_001328 [Diplocarpon rosae]|uniref:WD40 repeat-like protein n=1 Tax=Diplocarpon rosae TaxID=946125 RepID=A0AAD9T7N9_9HELO|nr:hypothetical protein QTJ16_001328 [Diplocarpon rosae]